jgi:hypothetical protein
VVVNVVIAGVPETTTTGGTAEGTVEVAVEG